MRTTLKPLAVTALIGMSLGGNGASVIERHMT
jgi:hypothetical protein